MSAANTPKLRMYAASIMALSQVIDADSETPSFMIEHEPALIPAESIRGAAHEAARLAFSKWPKGQYSNHEAIITPVTRQFTEELRPFLDTGIILDTDMPEATEKFTFVD